MKRVLEPLDILSPEAYEKVRDKKRRAIIAMKKNRRVAVGPYATFYFENYDTMWLQVHEMLRIEKGGDTQLLDELRAYNPLIPGGHELTATVMFEIDDAVRRGELLSRLGGIEDMMQLRVDGDIIKGVPEQDLEYTSADGKASSVQFVHFPFTNVQVQKFCAPQSEIIISINHISYGHMAVVPQAVKEELAKDFSV